MSWSRAVVMGVMATLGLGASPAQADSGDVLVVNFDGGAVGLGADDATHRTTPIAEMVGELAAYGDDPERREALLQAVRADWAPYDVVVTSTPPPSGDFAMVMVGPTNPFGEAVTGIATLDCDDAVSASSLAFAFYSADDGVPANVAATTISQEAAHGLGLEHVDAPGDIMLPVQGGGDASFTDDCLPISGPSECGPQHADECGSGDLQNAHAELLRRFGPGEPDTQPPTASISFPAGDFEMISGEPLSLTVEASDDKGLAEATLYVDGVGRSTDPDAPYGWELDDVPPGDYELYVVVADLGGNHATTEVIDLHVLPGDGSSDDDDGESGVGIPLPPPGPPPQPTSGCTIGPAGAVAWPWWLLLLLGSWRRRALG